MRVRLQWKILAGYLTVAGIGLGLAGWLAVDSLETKDMERLRESLTLQGHLATVLFASPLAQVPPDMQVIDHLTDRLGESNNLRVTVIASDGKVLGDSYESGDALRQMDNHLTRPEVREALASGLGTSVRLSDTVGIRMLNVALPVRSSDARLLGFVRLSLPLTEIEAQHQGLHAVLLGAITIAFLLSLVLSYLIARSITRPLADIVEAAERMARGAFYPRIRPRSNDEMAELAGALNTMAASIEATIDSMQEDRAKMATTLAAMQEGVMVLTPDGSVRLTNSAMERMIGRQATELSGRTHLEVIRHAKLNEFITRALSQGDGDSESEIALGAGHRIFQVRASPLPHGAEQSLGLVLVFHDITDLRRLEQVRKDFVANVSHELRTPLTAIKGYVEALRDDPKVDLQQRHRFLEIIATHTDRLNLIITDLLLLSKIESGQIPLKQDPIDLSRVLDRTLGLLNHLIVRKQHQMVITLPPDLPLVLGDEERLGQIFSNLLDNAIKYTPDQGTITIGATTVHKAMVEISVADTGIGIPPKDLPRIFERFYRVDKARSRELGGTGLGLAIVKHLVEAHGGTVAAESSGKGSAFVVRLPVAPSSSS